MDFQTFHKYNRLARRGVTKPLSCRHCGATMILAVEGPDDRPVLKCYACSVTVVPGTKMFADIRSVVEEYYVQEDE